MRHLPKVLWIIVILSLLVSFWGSLCVAPVYAGITPTPTITPSASPTSTPDPTPTVAPEPTPTNTPVFTPTDVPSTQEPGPQLSPAPSETPTPLPLLPESGDAFHITWWVLTLGGVLLFVFGGVLLARRRA